MNAEKSELKNSVNNSNVNSGRKHNASNEKRNLGGIVTTVSIKQALALKGFAHVKKGWKSGSMRHGLMCDYCGEHFDRFESAIYSERKFCSIKCRSLYHSDVLYLHNVVRNW